MTPFYTFNTLNDPDQGTSTDIRPFGQFYAPTSVASQCYNALFGKGNYDGGDPNLAVYLELQDNADSNIVLDSSGKERHGYLNKANTNTEDISFEDGPTGYLPRAMRPPQATGIYEVGGIAFGTQPASLPITNHYANYVDWSDIPESQGATFIAWVNFSSQLWGGPVVRRLRIANPNSGDTYTYGMIGNAPHLGSQSWFYGTGVTDPDRSRGSNIWYHLAYKFKDLNREIYVDGQSAVSAVASSSIAYTSTVGFTVGGTSQNASEGSSKYAAISVFNRDLSDAEIAEAYSGPEPYAQSMPSITGTPTVGEFVTINAGVWNSQNNGSIRYTYKMYSSSDTNGTDQRLEKEVTSYLTAQKILIRGSRLVGRYLSFEISAENDGGTDPLEVYNTGYTAAIGSGTDPTYVSYNALFGYGKHVPDPELQTRMLFDEDPTGDGFNQYGDWTITGNTLTDAALTEDGPTTYLSKSFQFPNTAPVMTVEAGKQDIVQYSWTFGGWIKQYNVGPAGVGGMVTLGSTNVNIGMYNSFTNMRFLPRWFPTLSFNWVNDVGYGNWHHLVGRHVNSSGISPAYLNADEAELFLNGQSKAYTNANNGAWTPNIYTGTVGGYLDGHLADFWWIERDLSDDEIAETYTGPEPVNITPATISGDFRVGFTISVNAGVWDSQNNGTITKTYQWYRADDANGTNLTAIPGETGSTYALSFDDHQKYVTVKERASNDGGYDELEDTYATYTSEIGLKGGMLVVKAG